jgi:hypothetical protein
MTTAADTLIIQYVKGGAGISLTFDSLKVYQSGKADLIISTFTSDSTKTYQLTQVELNDLIALFTNNNYSSLDSVYQSGCLACPVYSIMYGNKRARGNYTGTSIQLANIKAGLDTLVNKIMNATPVIYSKSKQTNSIGSASSSCHARLHLAGSTARAGIEIVREKGPDAYSILGQRMMQAH